MLKYKERKKLKKRKIFEVFVAQLLLVGVSSCSVGNENQKWDFGSAKNFDFEAFEKVDNGEKKYMPKEGKTVSSIEFEVSSKDNQIKKVYLNDQMSNIEFAKELFDDTLIYCDLLHGKLYETYYSKDFSENNYSFVDSADGTSKVVSNDSRDDFSIRQRNEDIYSSGYNVDYFFKTGFSKIQNDEGTDEYNYGTYYLKQELYSTDPYYKEGNNNYYNYKMELAQKDEDKSYHESVNMAQVNRYCEENLGIFSSEVFESTDSDGNFVVNPCYGFQKFDSILTQNRLGGFNSEYYPYIRSERFSDAINDYFDNHTSYEYKLTDKYIIIKNEKNYSEKISYVNSSLEEIEKLQKNVNDRDSFEFWFDYKNLEKKEIDFKGQKTTILYLPCAYVCWNDYDISHCEYELNEDNIRTQFSINPDRKIEIDSELNGKKYKSELIFAKSLKMINVNYSDKEIEKAKKNLLKDCDKNNIYANIKWLWEE